MAESAQVFDANLHHERMLVNPLLLQAALERAQAQRAKDPSNVAAARSLAELYRRLGRLAEAADAYARVCQLDPHDSEAAYLRALMAGDPLPVPAKGVRPAPFILVKNFLPPDFHDSLVPFVLANRDKFVKSRVGRHGEYKPDVRQTFEFKENWEGAPRFVEHLMKIPNIFERLHLEPSPFEIEAVKLRAYPDGHFYRIHMDAEPGAPSAIRLYNFVYFFNQHPRPYKGGELLLFDTDPNECRLTLSRFTCVVPEDNAIILFPCPYYHSVLPVRSPSGHFAHCRFIINGPVRRLAAGVRSDGASALSSAESVSQPV